MTLLTSEQLREPRPGIYETVYGNAAEFHEGHFAFDLDMREDIPVEMVDFTQFIREIE